MVGKRGWHFGFMIALLLSSILSVLAVWQEVGRWQTIGKESLASRHVGIQPNGYCCEHAEKVSCTPCVANPGCPPNSWAQGFCTNSNSAICIALAGSFCDNGGINKPGTIQVDKCWLVGGAENCPGGGVKCKIDTAKTKPVNIDYTDCGNATVSLCPNAKQPVVACELP